MSRRVSYLAKALERGRFLFKTGYVGGVSLVALFLVFTFARMTSGALVWGIAAFAVEVPLFSLSVASLIRMERLVVFHYGLKRRLRPPLSFKILGEPYRIDRWLLIQKEQSPDPDNHCSNQ